MGGGSSQSSSGSSSGQNTFNSNPVNLQYPGYTNLSGPVGQALSAAAFNPNPAQSFETGTGGFLQPSQIWNQDLGANVSSNNTGQNPLVGQITGQQNQQLGYVNQLSPGYALNYQGTPSNNAYTSAGQGSQFAGQNPFNWANTNAGNAAQYATGTYTPAANMINAAFGGAQQLFGTPQGTAQQAGNAANAIFGNAANPLSAGTANAMGSDFGGNLANYAGGQAAGGNFGVPQAENAAQYAASRGFGTRMAGQAAQFAGQNQNLQPAGQVLRREMDPNFAANLATGGPTQQVIRAAVNPMLQSFNAQTIPGLEGTFAAAGQRINSAGSGVGGSSAFDTAGANALTGLQANMGATAAGIVNPTYQQGIGITAAAPGQFAALQGQKLAGKESAAQTQLQTQQGREQALQGSAQTQAQTMSAQIGALNASAQQQLQSATGKTAAELQAAAEAGNLTAQESQALSQVAGIQTGIASGYAGAMTNAGQAMSNIGAQTAGAMTGASNASTAANQAEAGALSQAAQTNQGVATSQLNDTINALNASALPQLTQQYGINQGLSLYNQQVQQVLTTLGLGAQASQPAIGNVASGMGTSSGHNSSSGKGMSLA